MKQVKIRHLRKNPGQPSGKADISHPNAFPHPSIEPRDCLPESFQTIEVKNLADLVNLGYDNLQGFLRQWRETERSLSHEIAEAKEVVEFLQDNPTLDNFRDYARNFDHPTDLEWRMDWTDPSMPAPIEYDEDNPRESNTTNLNICGWCRFCHRGWARQNCALSGTCRLIPWSDADINNGRGPCQFNRPCFFLALAQSDPSGFFKYALYEAKMGLARLRLQRQRLKSVINMLTYAKNRSDHRPVFRDLRTRHYLDSGTHVKVLLAGSVYPISSQAKQTLHNGIVMPSQYQHEPIHPEDTSQRNLIANMCVAVQMSNAITIKLNKPIAGLGDCLSYVSYFTAHVLTLQDFQYLQCHHDYAKIWLDHLCAEGYPEQAVYWARNLEMIYNPPQK